MRKTLLATRLGSMKFQQLYALAFPIHSYRLQMVKCTGAGAFIAVYTCCQHPRFVTNFPYSNFNNGIYYLRANDSSQKYPVYCHMTAIPGCGKGGWTLVMKTNGSKVCHVT